jgi:Tol biopolymer transport system component
VPADPAKEVSLRKIRTATVTNFNPSFSPDGQRIVYSSTRSGHSEIWTSLADGSHPSQITHMDGPETGTPRWSPDGTKIAFDSSPNFNADIWIVNADGGAPRRLTTEPSAEYNPSWSRDGEWIYFTSNRTGTHELWKTPAAGGPAVQITRHGGFAGFESPDGKYLYYGTTYWNPALRRVPRDGGNEETLVLHFRYIHELKITRTGAYFLPDCEPCYSLKQPWELQRHRFSDGKIEVVARFRARMAMGMAVAPDESYVLVNASEKASANIMIVAGLP